MRLENYKVGRHLFIKMESENELNTSYIGKKLVPQLTTDGDSKELLEEIQKLKAEVAGKTKKKGKRK